MIDHYIPVFYNLTSPINMMDICKVLDAVRYSVFEPCCKDHKNYIILNFCPFLEWDISAKHSSNTSHWEHEAFGKDLVPTSVLKIHICNSQYNLLHSKLLTFSLLFLFCLTHNNLRAFIYLLSFLVSVKCTLNKIGVALSKSLNLSYFSDFLIIWMPHSAICALHLHVKIWTAQEFSWPYNSTGLLDLVFGVTKALKDLSWMNVLSKSLKTTGYGLTSSYITMTCRLPALPWWYGQYTSSPWHYLISVHNSTHPSLPARLCRVQHHSRPQLILIFWFQGT